MSISVFFFKKHVCFLLWVNMFGLQPILQVVCKTNIETELSKLNKTLCSLACWTLTMSHQFFFFVFANFTEWWEHGMTHTLFAFSGRFKHWSPSRQVGKPCRGNFTAKVKKLSELCNFALNVHATRTLWTWHPVRTSNMLRTRLNTENTLLRM